MWDKKALHEQCFVHKIEIAEDSNKRIIFLCPKMPDEKIQISLIQMLPKEIDYQFVISPRHSTIEALKVLLMSINFTGLMDEVDGLLRIQTPISIPDDHPFWIQVVEILSRDDYFTGWDIILGSKSISYNCEMAKEIQKNTKRDHSITPGDIEDLQISLGIERDVNEFIKELFPDETD